MGDTDTDLLPNSFLRSGLRIPTVTRRPRTPEMVVASLAHSRQVFRVALGMKDFHLDLLGRPPPTAIDAMRNQMLAGAGLIVDFTGLNE